MDSLLVVIGSFLTVYGILMNILYIVKEKGRFLDVISISWMGYTLYIAFSMFVIGLTMPIRPTLDAENYTAALAVIGTFAYTGGLYAGNGNLISRMIPVPASTLGQVQVWFIYFLCLGIAVVGMVVFKVVPNQMAVVIEGLNNGSIGALGLISLLVILTYRGKYVTKLMMVITLAVIAVIFLKIFWSRRPLVGLFLAGCAFVYHMKISWRGKSARALFFLSMAIGGISLLLFLGATRGERFYGSVLRSSHFLSSESIQSLLGGITSNYELFEFSVQQFPDKAHYLYGSGIVPGLLFFIPRSIWPSKPIASGGVITSMWYHTGISKTNVPNTGFGELYMNFGFLGILIGAFLVGKIIRGLNAYWWRNNQNIVVALAWFMIIPDFATEWRGDFTSMSVQAFLRISLFIIMAWVSRKIFGKQDNPELLEYEDQYYDQTAVNNENGESECG